MSRITYVAAVLALALTFAGLAAPFALAQLPDPVGPIPPLPTSTTSLPSSTGPIPSTSPPVELFPDDAPAPEGPQHGDPTPSSSTTTSSTTGSTKLPGPTVVRPSVPRLPVSVSFMTSAELPAELAEEDAHALTEENTSSPTKPSGTRFVLPGFELPIAVGALALIIAVIRRR